MDHLTEAQRQQLRKALVDERIALVHRVGTEADDAISAQEIGDVQDAAAEEMQRRQAYDRRERDEGRLKEVEAALGRMDDGAYGICEETGEPIPFKRLLAEPTTRYTVEALELLEEERARADVIGTSPESEAY